MKLRLALLSAIVTLLVIFTVVMVSQPLIRVLWDLARNSSQGGIDSRWLGDLVLLSGAVAFAIATSATYGVVVATIGRPLSQLQRAFESIARFDGDGSTKIVRRRGIDFEVKRLLTQIADERSASRQQLDALSQSNSDLLRAQTELVSADRLATVGKLAAGVAHEVGNPLAGILGYLSLLKMKSDNRDAVTDIAQRIELEVRRIDLIVRSLLELGRPSRGQATLIDVRAIVESCIRLLEKTPEFEQVQIILEAESTVMARTEAGPLAQILINLLRNSAQAMGSTGRIEVRTWSDEHHARISVRDEGPGLSNEVIQRLFEPFFSTRPAGEGTGLGLAVSKHLAIQLGGTLSGHNAPQGGALFQIDLPTT